MRNRPNYTVQIFRLAVLLVGFAVLAYFTANQLVSPEQLWVVGLLVLFSAIQAYYSLSLFSNRYPVLHATVLGCALLFGPVIVGWAAAIGMLVGFILAIARSKNASSRARLDRGLGDLSTIGVLLVALGVAFVFSAWEGENSSGERAVSIELLLPGVLFVLVHAALLLADAVLRTALEQPGSRRDLQWFIALEVLPIPMAAGIILTESANRSAVAVAIAILLTVFSVLLYYFQRAQEGKERFEQERQTLNLVSHAIQSTLDMDLLLPALQQLISQHFGVDNFYVAMYDEMENKIWYPLAVKRGQRQTWTSRHKADRLTDRVIFERQPILISSDAGHELVRIGLPAGEDPPAAWMGVPLRSSDWVIGCIALFTYSPEITFSPSDLALFVTLSGQVGVAVTNTMLYEKLQNRASQLEALNQFSIEVSNSLDADRVFSSLCQSVTLVANVSRSAVFVLDLELGTISLAYANGLSERFIRENRSYPIADDWRARCLRSGQPDLIADVRLADLEAESEELLLSEGVKALAHYPLATPDGQIGYLGLYYDENHDFDPEEVELVQTFSAQAAMAVSNARMHKRTDMALSRRVHQLSVLETISRELAGAIHSGQLYEMILNYSMEFTNSTWGIFSVFDPVTHRLQVVTQRGYQGAMAQASIDGGIPERSLDQQATVYIPDLTEEKGYPDHSLGRPRSHLSVPLIHHSTALGTISLESEIEHAFSDSDLAFVGQLANQAAIALQNARLFSEISNVRDRLSVVLNSVREGILLVDSRGQIVLTNKAVGGLTCQSINQFQNRLLEELPDNILASLGFTRQVPIVDQLRETSQKRMVINGASGERVLERTMMPVEGEVEPVTGWLLVLRDVTDELRVAQERELITETLIHDLRSPISAVLGALEVVESTLPARESSDSDMSYQALHVARRGAQRVLDLVENLLDIARMQAGKLELTRTQADLHKVAATVISDFLPQSTEYGVILLNKIPPEWPRLYVDLGKITRVISNLIDNALKYSPSGAQIAIMGEIDPRQQACLRIRDRGPGIPAEYREKIFERFGQIPGMRGRRRGTGLGLAFCKLAVEAHGGRIWVEPNADGGSDFVFTLPLVRWDANL